ncbi:MAG TPA: hypothetical protein VMA34_13710 [Terracidiphilus sp.]|nr:hypothetical protein [Terracidiphilus sp.]
MTILGQTLQLAFRIAFVWAAGFLIAVSVRAALSDKAGITFPSRNPLFVPYSRLGFWTCILAALTVTCMVVIHAMIVDMGAGSPR